ncbi:hypothetical protein [Moraxella sp.]|uniref:hypothetical protein n=1 Tax=Moraxella sp. TaxID=479 RepID=UPI0026DD6F83|nr:hypothetical protein [Moraxella sp.]MDO4894551.1 hypothetical protein [Moraxella sp.]
MNGFWENYYQNSIFSSNDKHFDLFRGLCLFGSLLVFPSIYIRVGVILTVLFIILTALLVFGLLKYLGEDVENAIKFFLLTAFVMLVFFAFTILADALKFIYILCTIFFLFVQDWCYRIGHRIFSDNYFNDFIADNVFNKFNALAFVGLLSYILMFVISVYFACDNFDDKIYENLKQQRLELLIDKNWLEQLIHNEYSIKMTLNNWINGKRQAITAFQKLFGKLGFIFIFFSAMGFIMPYFLNKYE